MMSETGQGMLDEGHAHEFTPESDMANLWSELMLPYTLNPLLTISLVKIEATFPWYMRLHMLMGTSPIVDKSALAHSTTAVGLNMLERTGAAQVRLFQHLLSYC